MQWICSNAKDLTCNGHGVHTPAWDLSSFCFCCGCCATSWGSLDLFEVDLRAYPALFTLFCVIPEFITFYIFLVPRTCHFAAWPSSECIFRVTHTRTYMQRNAHTHILAHVHTHIHTLAHTHKHTHTRTHTHIHTHTQTHTRRHTHTHTHTHTHAPQCLERHRVASLSRLHKIRSYL